ncbi:uncharacterized protein LOC117173961 [Belonocnema kinseyi]|uniref:uncharacterized protein LOC117173961 n=1 Tax=Belonocnema kinseyi TaxID=2817044 RepID=UPI00143D7053|nr:uncharacterized protein LOC117173961 [Belonocnema kinseyi]
MKIFITLLFILAFIILSTESTSRLSRVHPLDSRSSKRSRMIDTSGIGPPGNGLLGSTNVGNGLPRIRLSLNVPPQSNLSLKKYKYNFPLENHIKWEKESFDFEKVIVGQEYPVYANNNGYIYGIPNGGRICKLVGPNTRRTTVSMVDHRRHSFTDVFGPH